MGHSVNNRHLNSRTCTTHAREGARACVTVHVMCQRENNDDDNNIDSNNNNNNNDNNNK